MNESSSRQLDEREELSLVWSDPRRSATSAEIRQAREDMLAMLKADGEGPSGRFEDMRFLKPVKDYKARHASTMLTFDAVVDAIGQIEASRPVKAAG